jgi:hypothetical protein
VRDLEVLQDVLVLDVAVQGTDVSVDIYGSQSNVCGSIRFTFSERAERLHQVRLLRRWQRDQTPLTFVSHGSTVALTNDAALLARAAEQPALD